MPVIKSNAKWKAFGEKSAARQNSGGFSTREAAAKLAGKTAKKK